MQKSSVNWYNFFNLLDLKLIRIESHPTQFSNDLRGYHIMRKFTKSENLLLIFQFLTKYPRVKKFPYLKQHLIKEYQFQKITKLLRVAYNHTTFYRRKYDAARINPKDIRNWDDFKYLPTVTKDELIEYNEDFVDNRIPIEKLILSRSSGSTGKFVNIYFNAQAFITQEIQVVRMLKELHPKFQPLDNELLVYTSEYPFSSIGGFYKVNYIHNLVPAKQILETLLHLRPTIISIYPSILREIVDIYKGDYRALGIKTIITNSEHSTQLERDHFANLFGCSVFDEFSSEELLSIAYQCSRKQYHITQDCSHIELLSTYSDVEVEMGEQGELVGTCLTNFATPIIRYRQGDLAVLHNKGVCACGKTTPILQTITGRKNSSFKRPDGTEIPSGRILDWTYSLVLSSGLNIREFKVTQITLFNIEIDLSTKDNYEPKFDNLKVIQSFKQTFGQEFEVFINIVPQIMRTEAGKHIPIQSLL